MRDNPLAVALARYYLEEELQPLAGVQQPADWEAAYYNIRKNSRLWRSLERRFGGLSLILHRVFPEYIWSFPIEKSMAHTFLAPHKTNSTSHFKSTLYVIL